MDDYKNLISQQRQFFATGATFSIAFRLNQLKRLRRLLKAHEKEIIDALYQDLHKSPQEAVMSEIMLVMEELNYIIKHLRDWAKPKRTNTPFPALWPGKSTVRFEPYGVALIIAPWNYPFLLLMSPLMGAMCAGNCVIVKPSELASHTEKVIQHIINTNFAAEYIHAISADANQTTTLLKNKFDYLFFTGSTSVGKIMMRAAAEHLTPVTLELGGKSPCIVDQFVNLDFVARRIIWAKMLNAGQTCIAPDYIYVHQACKNQLIEKLKQAVQQFFGDDPERSDSFGRIINQHHFERICKLMADGNILIGGNTNATTRYIAPTVIDNVSWQDPIMQEEIFGPLLPILTFNTIDEVIEQIKQRDKPLALYAFTNNQDHERKIVKNVSFGGGCINDCTMHITNMHLPFGGVGPSGMGQYHGKYSFETFSHRKGIYKKTIALDFKLEYPPYSKKKLSWLRKLFQLSF